MFKCGDVVQLKSGGPLMTVENVINDNNVVVRCRWFVLNGDLHRSCVELFSGDMLELVEVKNHAKKK